MRLFYDFFLRFTYNTLNAKNFPIVQNETKVVAKWADFY